MLQDALPLLCNYHRLSTYTHLVATHPSNFNPHSIPPHPILPHHYIQHLHTGTSAPTQFTPPSCTTSIQPTHMATAGEALCRQPFCSSGVHCVSIATAVWRLLQAADTLLQQVEGASNLVGHSGCVQKIRARDFPQSSASFLAHRVTLGTPLKCCSGHKVNRSTVIGCTCTHTR